MTVVSTEQVHKGEIFLRLKKITKTFGGIHALEGVNLEVRRGEVLALLGDNGAGKTTLVKGAVRGVSCLQR
jgi:ABC-type sugar transport system ATPase subunit